MEYKIFEEYLPYRKEIVAYNEPCSNRTNSNKHKQKIFILTSMLHKYIIFKISEECHIEKTQSNISAFTLYILSNSQLRISLFWNG